MKKNFLNRFLSAFLAAGILAAATMPVSASGNVTYEFKKDTNHTIRWAEGIVPPEMPTEEEKGSFRKQLVTIGSGTFEVLEMPFKESQGWFDLTQEKKPEKEEKSEDSNGKNTAVEDNKDDKKKDKKLKKEVKLVYDSGYAASAANLTYWWLQQNQENLQMYLESGPEQKLKLADPKLLTEMLIAPASQKADEYEIFKLYMEVFPEDTEPDQLFDFFLNGYTASETEENSPEKYTPNEMGGFFYPVFEKNILTRRDEVTIQKLRDAVALNDGAILRLEGNKEIRYVNLWGFESDETGTPCALFVTDSQDELGMLRFELTEKEGLQIAGMQITGLYGVGLGEEQFKDYESSIKKPVPEQKPAQKPVPQPQTAWEEPTYEWSEDKSSCTARRTAKDDSENIETEAVKSVSEQTQAPTHNKPGIMTYTAEFDADWATTQVATAEIPQREITWNVPAYEWDESMRICTATRTSKEDSSVSETAMAGVKSKETREPTCTAKGQTTFTAEFDESWAETQVKVLDNIDMLTPDWGVTEYQWSKDYKTCTAVRVCKNETDGSHVEMASASITAEVSRKPTSSKKGVTTYTASFDVDWADPQVRSAEDIEVLDQNWTEPTYSWTQDMKTCIATRMDRNDPERKQIAETSVTSEITKPATCTAEGQTTYTAVFKESWAEKQTQVRSDIPKTEHDWGKVEYEWSEDHRSCIATRVCKNDKSHVETVKASVTSKTVKEPTVSSRGETLYRAEFGADWAEPQETTLEDIPVTEDKWGRPSYQWTQDFSKCIATRISQLDSSRMETAYAVVTSKRTKAPTSTLKGETTYTATFKEEWANTQKKVVANIPSLPGSSNETPKPSETPQWNKTTYEWNEDFTECTAKRTRRGDESKAEEITGIITKQVVKTPTCSVPGEAVYTAKFTELWAREQKAKGEIETLEHTLKKVPEVEATAAREGVQAHYECSECHKLFLDPQGKQEVTREQLRVAKPSVTEGFAILNGVPEKENLIAISIDKFAAAMNENPGASGVSISVGNASVTYAKEDIDEILRAAGDNKKLQLEIYRTDVLDSRLTPEQLETAERNPEGNFYRAQLSYVKNGVNIPVPNLKGANLTVPYTGTDAVRIYRVEEDGTMEEISGSYNDSYVTFQGENGVYMLSESRPSAAEPQKQKSSVGLIIWISVLVVSGLLCLGILGVYLYQKKLEQEELSAPHKFSQMGKAEEETAFNEEAEEFDEEEFLRELDLSDEIDLPQEASSDAPGSVPEKNAGVDVPVSPTVPKSPMEPTIAEKTAEAAHKKKL